MDMKVHVIKIDAAGKTKEEIEKEVASQIANELNVANKAEETKPEAEKTHILIKAEVSSQDSEKVGYDCEVDMEGKQGDLFNLLVHLTASALNQMQGIDSRIALRFGSAVAMESIKMMSNKKDGE